MLAIGSTPCFILMLLLASIMFLLQENVEEWLINLGLDEYWPKFLSNSYTEPQDLADLKYMTQDAIATLFDMRKEAHLKRLKMATSVLQYPTKGLYQYEEKAKF